MWTKRLPTDYDCLAPDQSEIRLLLETKETKRGSLVHCTLPPGATSLAVAHKSVEEIWYVLQGSGQLWRKQGNREEMVGLQPGVCVMIPTRTHFQFRSSSDEPLSLILSTMPVWTGEHEAERVPDHWPVTRKEGTSKPTYKGSESS